VSPSRPTAGATTAAERRSSAIAAATPRSPAPATARCASPTTRSPAELDYTIRRSARARRIRVCVDPHGAIEVVLPHRAPKREAQAAVAELRPWIEKRLAQARAARERLQPPPGTVPFLDARLSLRRQPGRARVHRAGDELLVPATGTTQALERWYRNQARSHIEPLLHQAAQALGRRHTTLSIRNQRTRWGSCSASGAMSFNWRLMLAPEPVLDYVVWHEACHLVVMDHSKRFGALVERHVPGYRHPRRWLRENGAALHLQLFP
jgi:predicted metal-dependent hydrolase